MEVEQVPSRQEYVHYFRLSETVLRDLLPKLSDEEIIQLVSNQNWVALPLHGEETKEETANRHDPHIDLRLTKPFVRIGLRSNTVPSVEKLKNILQEYHTSEKSDLVRAMGDLDDDFQTAVYAKVKEHNWAERGDYEIRFQRQTNKIDDAGFDQMFASSDRVRGEGKERMRDRSLAHNPITPVIDLAYATIIRGDDQNFMAKLSQLKPLYEICLKVKTAGAIQSLERSSKKNMSTRSAIFSCPKCGKKFTKDEARAKRFCDVDGMKIRVVFVYDD